MIFIKKILFLFLLFAFPFYAQSKQIIKYSTEDGLCSNLTKSTIQDKNSYIWISSDAGLMRFNGKSFELFNSGLKSLYVKDIKVINETELLILTDEGVGILQKKGFTYRFIPITELQKDKKEIKLNNPKTSFISKDGTIWIGDLTSVYSFKNGILKKYPFADIYAADSYVRSFLFYEDKEGNLLLSSWRGNLFVLNKKEDSFLPLNVELPATGFSIEAIYEKSGDLLWLASAIGIYELTFEKGFSNCRLTRLYDLKDVSSFAKDNHGNFFIGTYNNGLFYLTGDSGKKIKRFDNLNFSSIKNLFTDNEDNLWVNSDEGVALVKTNSFFQIDISQYFKNKNNIFIKNLDINKNSEVFFNDINEIYKIRFDKSAPSLTKYSNWKHSQIYSFALSRKGVWISYIDESFELRDKNKFNVLFTHRTEHNRMNQLFVDDNDNLWAFSERNKQIYSVKNSSDIRNYQLHNDLNYITVIKQLRDKNIYSAGIGKNSFLFRYDPVSDKFQNLSPEQGDEFYPPFTIFDMVQDKENRLHFASNKGYYILEKGKLNKIPLPLEYANTIARAITIDKNDNIYIGTEKGVIILNREKIVFFDKQEGLPNSSIVQRSIAFDSLGRLWAATASGIAYGYFNLVNYKATPKPRISDIKISTISVSDSTEPEVRSGYNISFDFSSLTYPSIKTQYQFRLIGLDTNWSAPLSVNSTFYSKLPVGNYIFEVRAITTGQFPSEITSVPFSVYPAWYMTIYAVALYLILGIIFVIYLSFLFHNKKIKVLEQREKHLKQQVELRTKALQAEKEKAEELLKETEKAKLQLEESNELKSQLLSIAAHDLKNPLSVIMSYSSEINSISDNADVKFMSKVLNDVSNKMLNIIVELLESVAAKAQNAVLDKKVVNVNDLTAKATEINILRATQKKQTISSFLEGEYFVFIDEDLVKHAVDNLLSNAVKYSPIGSRIKIFTEQEESSVRICINDEGPGFTDEDKKKLFGKFQRLSAKPTGNESSTGLGLSMVKDIVERNGGKVWVESIYGKGSTFIIELPLWNDAAFTI